jgi:hypothetical protein
MNSSRIDDLIALQLRFSSIGRILDPRYPTNLAIMAVTPLAGIVAGILSLLSGETLTQAISAGFYTGASVFIAWVIGREFDPDHPWVTFFGVGLAFIASLFADPPSIWSLAALIVLARIVNRIVGPPSKIGDSVVALALTGLALFTGWWVFAVVAAVAFVLDATLSKPNRHQWIFAGLALGGMLVSIIINEGNKPYAASAWTIPVLIAVVVIAYVIATTEVKSGCDVASYTLDNRRMQAAMGLMLFAGVLFELWAGTPGLMAMLPLWAAIIGASVWRLWEMATQG